MTNYNNQRRFAFLCLVTFTVVLVGFTWNDTFRDEEFSVTDIQVERQTLFDTGSSLGPNFQKYLQMRQACLATLDVFAGHQPLQYKLLYSSLGVSFINRTLQTFTGLDHSKMRVLQVSLVDIRETVVELQKMGFDDTAEFEVSSKVLPLFGNWLKTLKNDFLTGQKFGSHWSQCKQKLASEQRKILDKLKSLQKGSICLQSKKANDLRRELYGNIGMGSILHKMGQCLALGLATNVTCFIDDSIWTYDPGNYKMYFNNSNHCGPKSSFEVDSNYISYKPKTPQLKNLSIPALPRYLWDKLAHCHEDLVVWYAGVLLKYSIEPTPSVSRKIDIQQQKLGQVFADIQVRSIEHFEHTVWPEAYIKYLQMAMKFDSEFSTIKNVWVATDQQTNIDKIEADNSDFQYFHMDKHYFDNFRLKGDQKHLTGVLVDLHMSFRARLLIGRMSSNLIRAAYEYRSVEDPWALDSTFSLDMLYFMDPEYRPQKWLLFDSTVILSTPFVLEPKKYPTSEDDLNKTILCGENPRVVEVSDNIRPPFSKEIPRRDGFRKISVDCRDGRKQTAYVPVFVLQKIYYTYQAGTDTHLQLSYIGQENTR